MMGGLYFIILLHGRTQIEVRAKAPMTLEQCYAFGEGWRARTVGNRYECHRIPLSMGNKP